MIKGRYTFEAYRVAFQDPRFYQSFGYSLLWAIVTILISLLLVVPTAYWVQLKLPKARPYVEFVTLMPFVVPAVVLTFGLVRLYGRPPLILTTTPAALIVGYVVLSLPYMYRSVDSGLRAVDIRTLTEAAQSLGRLGTITQGRDLPQPARRPAERHLPDLRDCDGRVHVRQPAVVAGFWSIHRGDRRHAGLYAAGGIADELPDHLGLDHADPVGRPRRSRTASANRRSTLGQRGDDGISGHQSRK
jgi:hypothetical protein